MSGSKACIWGDYEKRVSDWGDYENKVSDYEKEISDREKKIADWEKKVSEWENEGPESANRLYTPEPRPVYMKLNAHTSTEEEAKKNYYCEGLNVDFKLLVKNESVYEDISQSEILSKVVHKVLAYYKAKFIRFTPKYSSVTSCEILVTLKNKSSEDELFHGFIESLIRRDRKSIHDDPIIVIRAYDVSKGTCRYNVLYHDRVELHELTSTPTLQKVYPYPKEK